MSMDTPSHGLWSFVFWHSTPFPLLAVLVGVLPDIISFWPATVYNTIKKGKPADPMRCKSHPKWMQIYTNALFHVTHSLVIATAVSITVFLVWGAQWWILAWPLHVFIDIFSHSKADATPFMWPLFNYQVNGRNWSLKYATVNGVLLLAVLLVLLR
jgi:hypothetical protein